MTYAKDIRLQSGMSQTDLAAAAGTSQPTISAYESGTKQPSLATLERLARAAGAEMHVVFVDQTVLSTAVTEARKRVTNRSEAFRILADASVRLERMDEDDLRRAISSDPGRIGAGWDALVGGIAERLARVRSLPVPAWTRDHHRFSDVFWFVSEFPSVRASALVRTPPELATRKVFLHPESLTGV